LARPKVIKKKALLAMTKGRISEAAKLFVQVCTQDPADIEAWEYLGELRLKQGLFHDATQCYQKTVSIMPNNAKAYLGLAEALFGAGKLVEAQSTCQRVLQIDASLAGAYYVLGNICRDQGAFDVAEQNFSQAVKLKPDLVLAQYYRGNMLRLQGRVDEAVACYDDVMRLDANIVEAFWNKHLILPVIIDEESQIEKSRHIFSDGIKVLKDSLDLKSAEGRKKALRGIKANTNFYLQYQGCDDKTLQCQYGDLIQSVVSVVYPQWSKSLKQYPIKTDQKIKIGYVTAFLRAHNGAVWLLGWLKNCDRNKFEIYLYHTGSAVDSKTDEFKELSDNFNHIPNDIEKVCKKIYSDKLNVLVYPEIGMDAQSLVTAGLRLAPVQCVGWGHPMTSGLNTMDYWLSSDLMEVENGQSHYSETLIRLPNMANSHPVKQHDELQQSALSKTRNDFGLSDDNILYFCSQSLFKYLPQYDYLWPKIAKQVPTAKFVFLAISSVHVVKKFMARIERAFTAAGLNAEDYCVMLNRQSPDDYLQLNKLVDVFLDNPPWSGNNTGMAAIDAHLPIVCYPTELMRGRHSYAILTMLGVTETIASSAQEYIDIAVKLGIDKQYRQSIVKKIADNHQQIYEDVECVKGLESFYVDACSSNE